MSTQKSIARLGLAWALAGAAWAVPLEVKGADSLPGVSLEVRGAWKLSEPRFQRPHEAAYILGNTQLLNVMIQSERSLQGAKQYQELMLAKTKQMLAAPQALPGQSSGPIQLGLSPGVVLREKQGFIAYVGTKQAICIIRYLDLAHPQGCNYAGILQDVCDHFHWTH